MNKLPTPIPKMIHPGSGVEFHKIVAETRGQVKVLLRHRGTGASEIFKEAHRCTAQGV